MGRGTGRSARTEQLRRDARQYMDQCRDAIPVWIMPRYLVAEMIVDPASGRYDLVIVDEASQLGVESLFLFYISKKMVVVGDDQQISPYGVGTPKRPLTVFGITISTVSHTNLLFQLRVASTATPRSASNRISCCASIFAVCRKLSSSRTTFAMRTTAPHLIRLEPIRPID